MFKGKRTALECPKAVSMIIVPEYLTVTVPSAERVRAHSVDAVLFVLVPV